MLFETKWRREGRVVVPPLDDVICGPVDVIRRERETHGERTQHSQPSNGV